jgi:hypothetical protein
MTKDGHGDLATQTTLPVPIPTRRVFSLFHVEIKLFEKFLHNYVEIMHYNGGTNKYVI